MTTKKDSKNYLLCLTFVGVLSYFDKPKYSLKKPIISLSLSCVNSISVEDIIPSLHAKYITF